MIALERARILSTWKSAAEELICWRMLEVAA